MHLNIYYIQSTVESEEGEDRGEWTVNKRAVTKMWGFLDTFVI